MSGGVRMPQAGESASARRDRAYHLHPTTNLASVQSTGRW